MALDTATVRRIATLARIKVPEADLEGLAGELSHILGWVEQLGEVPTEGVEPMASVFTEQAPLRADQVDKGETAEAVLNNAPEREAAFFAVPKVVE